MKIKIEIIKTEDILIILPLLSIIITKTSTDLLQKRVLEMANLSHYECIGLFVDGNLSGISGLWYSTKHYIGKTVEPDHVEIDTSLRKKRLRKTVF